MCGCNDLPDRVYARRRAARHWKRDAGDAVVLYNCIAGTYWNSAAERVCKQMVTGDRIAFFGNSGIFMAGAGGAFGERAAYSGIFASDYDAGIFSGRGV